MAAQVSPIQVPMTNGFVRSFGHVRLNIAGLEFTGGFADVSYSRKRTREKPMSNSPDPIGKTLGENAYECKVVMYYDWFMNLLQTIQQNLGPGYGDQPFITYCSYVGANLTTYTDTIYNCTFDTTDAKNSKGVAALTREIDLSPTKIKFGNPAYDDLAVPLVAPPQ